MQNRGVYIHIPFCSVKCHYCSFYTVYYHRSGKSLEPYLDTLGEEIRLHSLNPDIHDRPIDSIYIGGGTPSLLKADSVETLLNTLRGYLPLVDLKELTIEINPEDGDQQKFREYRSLGINRVSIGVQSMQDKLLEISGRNHRRQEIHKTLLGLQQAGFENISVDLLLGMPGQTEEHLREDLKLLWDYPLRHISLYILTLEERSPWFHQEKKIEIAEDTVADLYGELVAGLNEKGFQQYEISNFAQPGFEGYHNAKYWNYDEYLGLGTAAYSFLGKERFNNFQSMTRYRKAVESGQIPIEKKEILSWEKQLAEFIFLSLRKTRDGLNIKQVNQLFQIDFLSRYEETLHRFLDLRLLFLKDQRLCLTPAGVLVSDSIFSEFMTV